MADFGLGESSTLALAPERWAGVGGISPIFSGGRLGEDVDALSSLAIVSAPGSSTCLCDCDVEGVETVSSTARASDDDDDCLVRRRGGGPLCARIEPVPASALLLLLLLSSDCGVSATSDASPAACAEGTECWRIGSGGRLCGACGACGTVPCGESGCTGVGRGSDVEGGETTLIANAGGV